MAGFGEGVELDYSFLVDTQDLVVAEQMNFALKIRLAAIMDLLLRVPHTMCSHPVKKRARVSLVSEHCSHQMTSTQEGPTSEDIAHTINCRPTAREFMNA